MTLQVVIVQELLAQYRVPFYQRLREQLADQDVGLSVVHGRAAGPRREHSDEACLPWARVIENRSLHLGRLHLVAQPVVRDAARADLLVVEHANRFIVNQLLLLASRVSDRLPPTALWGHGANLQSANDSGWTERLKRWTAKKPHWWFAYTAGSAERVAALGYPRARITVVQNSVDTTGYRGSEQPAGKDALSCAFVGSLHKYKRIPFLLEVARRVFEQEPSFRLILVGDGPARDLVTSVSAPWLDYRGADFGRAKREALGRSSLMLMPGLVGLVAVEAFAAGTPIVTTDVGYHSPEFEYLDQTNAVVLPAGASPEAFAQRVLELLRDHVALATLQAGCRAAADTYTLDAMVDRYAQGIHQALSAPRW